MVAPRVGAWIETFSFGVIGSGMAVAPRVGAWIETVRSHRTTYHDLSLPAWERGLKRLNPQGITKPLNVAPRVGAWIETWVLGVNSINASVAPRVGAWIETIKPSGYCEVTVSLPAWERGLKLFGEHGKTHPGKSLPAWERGLKLLYDVSAHVFTSSLPAWERGLKH